MFRNGRRAPVHVRHVRWLRSFGPNQLAGSAESVTRRAWPGECDPESVTRRAITEALSEWEYMAAYSIVEWQTLCKVQLAFHWAVQFCITKKIIDAWATLVLLCAANNTLHEKKIGTTVDPQFRTISRAKVSVLNVSSVFSHSILKYIILSTTRTVPKFVDPR